MNDKLMVCYFILDIPDDAIWEDFKVLAIDHIEPLYNVIKAEPNENYEVISNSIFNVHLLSNMFSSQIQC